MTPTRDGIRAELAELTRSRASKIDKVAVLLVDIDADTRRIDELVEDLSTLPPAAT